MNTTDMRIPSNKVRDIECYCLTELHGIYPNGEIRAMTNLLFEAFMGWSLAQLLLHRDDTINQSVLLKFHWAVEDLKRQRPIQHIIGYTDFCGCRIQVSPDVLIPRPETEEIVLQTAQIAAAFGSPRRILDLCTGSGCIAIALSKKFPNAQVWGIDISQEALTVAQENNCLNETSVTFLHGDVLHGIPPLETMDLIISNPPYIQERERAEMRANVLDYEPSRALFVPDSDPLLFYHAIGKYATSHLTPSGLIVLEINEHLGKETCELLASIGFESELRQDFHGKDRMVVARRK